MAETTVTPIGEADVKVRRVRVVGLKRTKNDIVVEQIKGVLKAKTLYEALFLALESKAKLEALNVFKNISLQLDTAKDKDDVEIGGMQVDFIVEEYGRIASALSASAGSQTGDASASLSLRNLFGRAELVKASSTSTFPNWGQTFTVEFSKPYYKDITKRFCAGVGTTVVQQPVSGYKESIAGSKVEFTWLSWLGSHGLSWFCDWRQVLGLNSFIPMEIRHQSGHSLKSSIRHSVQTDMRDDPAVPCNGYTSALTQEVAGLGGDVFFSKSEMRSEFFKELYNKWVVGVSLWFGLLKSFSSQSKINDRFFLGGATTLRGFQMWGIGPRKQGYSLGGDAYWATGLHLYAPLPFTSGEFFRRIRMHAFTTAGNLIPLKNLRDLRNLSMNIRLSCGVGLCARLGIGQIELNYAWPLRAEQTDGLKPGLQLGIGIDML